VLYFNEPSTYNGWWDDDEWRERFGYRTAYGTADDGLTLSIGADATVSIDEDG
jgi:hypothetical protein